MMLVTLRKPQKRVKNIQSASWFLAAEEGRYRRATRQKEKGKNFQITFLVASQSCLLTLEKSQSLI